MLTDLEKNAIRDHYQNIGKNLPGFRPRASQREMIAAVANAFSRTLTREEGEEAPKREGESIAVIEGPTGVGKSLAYLLAGGIMAQTRGKRLIVSSATVALQEQLVDRDLPFLVEKSGLELTFALAKGRGRYLCPYKLYQLTQNNAQQNLLGFEAPEVLWDSKPKPEKLNLLRDIADEFSARRFNGDRDTWPEKIDDAIWLKVTNDRHGCLKAACPNRAECPFYLARDMLETVDVVVANHDLLLADISMGGGVILPAPENSFYCIDEAHHLPKKALSRFAAEHSWNIAVWTLEKLPQLTGKIAALTDKAELANLADEAASSLLDSLHEWQFHLAEEPSLSLGPSENDRRTNSEPTWLWEDGKIPEGLETTVSNTAIAARSLLKHVIGLNDALSAARREKEQDSALIDRLTGEFGLFISRIEQISAVWDLLSTVPIEGEEPLAKWITRRADDKNDYIFNASPISSASHLANSLWRRAAGAVLTSATLQSLGNFNLMLRQTGLQWLPETTTLALKSPFDFEKQGELYIPPIYASPKDPEAHTAAIIEWLPKLISPGEAIGTLVLFSSRKQMQDVALQLPDDYLPLLLVQGELPKAVLLQKHHRAIEEGKASIIFGLDSFAEGLDLPGTACVQVIIAKLPFAMPDNPIEKTQNRWIEQRGGNPFIEITVPEAGIKLIQAVGRLIRTEQDYGRVTILDNRVKTQRYGQQLLAGLPPFKRIG
ncbi:TPA: ATP-dependent DNA helicase DinG [Neisseria meningitidis]|uniref:ATP-dependent DNA helicase DinG n=1 Tax=Neisseria meningitidis TaxID=487 RepID=X5FBX3_NEIME|nr:ATP-dependent DNA helicase DinG [Neisseria meningitidis]EOB88788.1 DEAD/DEAH box helicase family protein [Neisseria meningitidis NM604]AHW76758.1 putative ATP-dependent helicase DinG (DNA-damage-inducible protein G) [Neisseria meningitidis]ELK68761.1 DEAD/DEAH box helicase family protein [Neisseria meningitidis 88050]ELL11416.1 DEAD/DEAH box helicase family protein [Neisseria meningitidis 96023]ELL11621.1 DEAD/DEAH box helicase family protein [Neisseria meningitidis 2004090]